MSEDELKGLLNNQFIIEVHKLPGREGDATCSAVISFLHSILPAKVTVGWEAIPVRQFIPKPTRLLPLPKVWPHCYKVQGQGGSLF